MTSTSVRSVDPLSTNIVHRGEAEAGPFMLTLCRLVEPVSIRPPQSPHLKPFTFFTSRARQQDGSEQSYLHMGFFETLAYAERWARAVRGRHPEAVATIAPPTCWFSATPEGPARLSDGRQETSPNTGHLAPAGNEPLTDTQVLNILETRRPTALRKDTSDRGREQIEMLRPDDTGTRRALREAVAKGASVSFAVQLHWSARPIDPGGVPSLEIFRQYTVYAVESRRASRSCFFLRLGFFGDPISAREVAFHLRSSFASAAVVPVLEEEIARARAACNEISWIPCLVQQRPDHSFESGGTPRLATASRPENGRRRGASLGAETLEQTLAQLAEREMWNDPDLLSDTGVRHVEVVVEKRTSGDRH